MELWLLLQMEVESVNMTNREWLETLSDEEFVKWCLWKQEFDFIRMQPIQPAPTLDHIKTSWNSSYAGLLNWLKEERK